MLVLGCNEYMLIDSVVSAYRRHSQSELMGMRKTICVNEVRLSIIIWTNIRQADISVCASTHRDVRDGANTHIHGHVSYTRRPRARGQMAPNIDNE